ncbi:hypothetical protein NP147_14440, partial [Salmonella enterica]|nr:hypothetical protein [Salmonella enterica]
RGCNPTSSKFIHTWLRFGEIMRGSLSASLTAAYSRKKNGKAISAQHFNFHPVLTSLFHFCYTLSGDCCSTY